MKPLLTKIAWPLTGFLILICTAFADGQNVGIGTTTPQEKLDVVGNIRSAGLRVLNHNSLDLGVGVSGKETNAGRLGYGLFSTHTLDIVGGGTGTDNRRIRFWAEDLAEFTGKGQFSGNVGIGTAPTTSMLTITSPTNTQLTLRNNNPMTAGVTSTLAFGGSNYTTGLIQTIGTTPSTARMGFSTGYSVSGVPNLLQEQLTISNNGNIGIGATTPAAKLQVNNGNVVFSHAGAPPTTPGEAPVSGNGRRMMWYSDKAAFRVGFALHDEWDTDKIGNYSVAMGHGTTASGIGSTALGWVTNASGNYSTALGAQVSTGGYHGAFIIGDRSTTGTASTAENQMTMRFAGGYRLFTGTTGTGTSSGVTLATNGNSWASVSDSTQKEYFQPADGKDFLRKIDGLRLGSWNYKGQDKRAYRHYGPMAQEFFAAFGHDGIGTIGTDTTIASADIDGVMMIAIKALIQENADLRIKNEKTAAESKELKTAITELSRRLDELYLTKNQYPVSLSSNPKP